MPKNTIVLIQRGDDGNRVSFDHIYPPAMHELREPIFNPDTFELSGYKKTVDEVMTAHGERLCREHLFDEFALIDKTDKPEKHYYSAVDIKAGKLTFNKKVKDKIDAEIAKNNAVVLNGSVKG